MYGPSGLLLALWASSGLKHYINKSITILWTNHQQIQKFCPQIQKILLTNPKYFVDKSKIFCQQIPKFSLTNQFFWQILKNLSANPKNFVHKFKKFRRQIQKSSSTNPKHFVDKSKKFGRQIQKISSTNPKNFVNKSKKIVDKSKIFCPEIHKFRNPELQKFIFFGKSSDFEISGSPVTLSVAKI